MVGGHRLLGDLVLGGNELYQPKHGWFWGSSSIQHVRLAGGIFVCIGCIGACISSSQVPSAHLDHLLCGCAGVLLFAPDLQR